MGIVHETHLHLGRKWQRESARYVFTQTRESLMDLETATNKQMLLIVTSGERSEERHVLVPESENSSNINHFLASQQMRNENTQLIELESEACRRSASFISTGAGKKRTWLPSRTRSNVFTKKSVTFTHGACSPDSVHGSDPDLI